MSEPEPTGLPPVSSQRGTQPMALPPLSLPPSKIDPLSSLSTHHSYPSPIISSQMMASPLMSMSPSASSQVHSPLNQHILSPQSKSSFGQNTACSTSVQNQQQSQLQDFRRQNLIPGQSPDNYRAQFSHTVTTLPSNKRNVTGVHDIIGRQIQSVPSSPTMSSNSTPPQSVQMVRHGSLDALPSPGSSSSMGNPSPSSYSNHSSPMMAGQSQNMPNGHGSHSSFSTQQASSTPSQPHVVQRVAYSNQEHSVGGAIQIPQKQIAQQESTQGRISGHAGGTHMSVSINQAARNHQPILTTGQPYGTQPHQSVVAPNPSPLQQQLSSRSSQSESNSQANVLIQHQPLPPQNGTSQGQGAPLQQQQAISGRQLLHQQEIPSGPSRAIPSREVMTSPQIVTSQQQQQTVLGLLQGAAQQQAQAAYAVSGGSAQNTPLSHQQVRQMLSQRTQNTLTIPNAPSTTSSLQQVLSSRPPPLPVATQRSAQHPGQIMVQHPIHPSQANLPVRSVLAAQQQVLLQQQSRLPLQSLPGPSASTSSTAPRVVSASSAPVLAAVYDLDKPGIKSNKQQYRIFKKKFKYLVFENECYQEELRNLQRKLLKLSRDKNFLLDRLMQFEKLSDSSDDDSDSSQKTADERPKTKKRIRPSQRKRTADESLSDIGGKRFMDSSMGSTPSPSPSPAPSVTTVLAPSTSGHYTMSPVGSTPEASPVKTASVHHCPPGPSTTSAVVRSTNSSRSLLSSKEGVDSSVQRQSSQRPESHPSLATVDLRPSPLRVKVESLPLPPAKKNFAVMNPSTSSNRTLSSQPIPSPNNPGLSASSVSIRNSMLNGSAVEGPVTSLPIPLVSMSSASFSVATSTAPSPSEVVQHLVSMVPPQLGIRTSFTFTSAPSLPPSVSHLNGQMPMNTKKEGSEERPFVSVSQPR